jgi:hypothetical protein
MLLPGRIISAHTVTRRFTDRYEERYHQETQCGASKGIFQYQPVQSRRCVERDGRGGSAFPYVNYDLFLRSQANALEESLSRRLNAISQNLHKALRTHSKNAHEDVTVALLENARFTVGFHRMYLKELEALRPDIAKIGTNSPISNTNTKPSSSSTPSYTPIPAYQPTPTYTMPPSTQNIVTNYATPPIPAPPMDGTKSMFLPPPSQSPARPNSTGPQVAIPVPLAGGMAQSMMLPGQSQTAAQRAQNSGRNGTRRLDERQVAKLLAGGF